MGKCIGLVVLRYLKTKHSTHLSVFMRKPCISIPEKVIELETQIMDRFNQRSVPFLSKPLDKKNDWEVLFFMQHYGIPTRLLDWSENPFVALYFALTSASYKIVSKKREYEEDACIWVLDPIVWNQESLNNHLQSRWVC